MYNLDFVSHCDSSIGWHVTRWGMWESAERMEVKGEGKIGTQLNFP